MTIASLGAQPYCMREQTAYMSLSMDVEGRITYTAPPHQYTNDGACALVQCECACASAHGGDRRRARKRRRGDGCLGGGCSSHLKICTVPFSDDTHSSDDDSCDAHNMQRVLMWRASRDCLRG